MSSWAMSIWRDLGIKRTRDRVAIARAYADRIAEIDPETEPRRAQALCDAYRRAHRFCDAVDSGPVPRIGPPRIGPVRALAAKIGAVRPRRICPARAQEVTRALDGLSQTIVAALRRQDQKTAIAGLRGLFRDPLSGNLHLRWLVEQRLLEEVATLADPPVEFCIAAVAAFQWDDNPRHLPPRSRRLADGLCAIAEGERRVAGLRRLARRWAVRMWFDRSALAAALICGPYRPLAFRLAVLDPFTARAVKRLLAELRARHAAAVARALDRRVVAWWDRALDKSDGPLPRSDRAA